MVRAYDRREVQVQIHLLCEYFEEHYPREYKEYLNRKNKMHGIGDVAIRKLDELSGKVESLGKALIESSSGDEEPDDEERMPPIPMVGSPESRGDGLRPITQEEAIACIDNYTPVFLDKKFDDLDRKVNLMGNITGYIEEEGGIVLEVDVGQADVIAAPIEFVYIEK